MQTKKHKLEKISLTNLEMKGDFISLKQWKNHRGKKHNRSDVFIFMM